VDVITILTKEYNYRGDILEILNIAEDMPEENLEWRNSAISCPLFKYFKLHRGKVSRMGFKARWGLRWLFAEAKVQPSLTGSELYDSCWGYFILKICNPVPT